MAFKRGEKRSGDRNAKRQPVVDDDDDSDQQSDDVMSDAELLAQIRSASGRSGGNAEAVALGYLRDIRRIRKVKNEWKRKYEELAEEYPEDSVVLVGEEANAVRELIEARKLDPKKLKSLIETLESDLAAERKTNLDHTEKLTSSRVAELTGYNKDAWDAVRRNGNLAVEFKQIEVDEKGQKVKKDFPFVRPKGDEKAALVKADEWIEANQKYMWPALKSGNGAPQQQGRPSGTTTAVVDGTPAPREGTSGETDPVKASLERDKQRAIQRGNPLDFLNRGGVAPAVPSKSAV